MSATTHTSNGHAPPRAPADTPTGAHRRSQVVATLAEPLALPYAFTDTVLRYLLLVLPPATRELAHWRSRAAEIPNPNLRRHALEAIGKRGNIEGAALLATLAPACERRRTLRALVAYQTAYNYLDTLSELTSPDPEANARQLHEGLLTALLPDVVHSDYYAYNPDAGDGGFLAAVIDTCRRALAGLPSFDVAGPTAVLAAHRTLAFQTLNLSETNGGHGELERWATDATPPSSRLEWFEVAAAAGSSLAVHALIAASAHPDLDAREVREIDRAYFPWVGGLHSLLDSLVDRGEDHRKGQRSLIGYYRSPTDAAIRLAALASRSRRAAEHLPDRHAHRVILTAMCSYYLSAPECRTAEGQTVGRAVSRSLGSPLDVALAMFRMRRLMHSLTDRAYT